MIDSWEVRLLDLNTGVWFVFTYTFSGVTVFLHQVRQDLTTKPVRILTSKLCLILFVCVRKAEVNKVFRDGDVSASVRLSVFDGVDAH